MKSLVLTFFIFFGALTTNAQMAENPQEAELYRDHQMYFDTSGFNDWLSNSESVSTEQSTKELEALLFSPKSNFERMKLCNNRFTEHHRFFKMNVTASAQKILVHYARMAMEEIETFPFGLSSFVMSPETRKHVISSLYMCAEFDIDQQSDSKANRAELVKRYGDLSLVPCVSRFSSIASVSEEQKNRKLRALQGLYRLLAILGCSEMENVSRTADPEYREDAKRLIELVRRNVDLSDSEMGLQFKYWLGFP